MRLADKVVIISGSTSGIGRAAAILFAREGAKVVVVGRRLEAGQMTIDEIKGMGGEAIFVKADVLDIEQVKSLVNRALSAYNKIDILYNSAAIHPESAQKPLADCSVEDWDKIVGINVKGIFLTCKYVIPEMIKKGGGVIINTSSMLGVVAVKERGIYSTTKGAIIMLTKSMALDYASSHIRVNCICPGVVETEMSKSIVEAAKRDEVSWRRMMESHPIGRLGCPEDIANAALFLASDESSWITGSCLMVDGGYTAQ